MCFVRACVFFVCVRVCVCACVRVCIYILSFAQILYLRVSLGIG